jgi:site-specific recombinase XerD
MEEGFTNADSFASLKRPKLPEPLIEILSDEEITIIVQGINANSFLGARLYAVVLLLLDTGFRAEELCTLTVDSTSLSQGTIKVMGKGRKERIVPFGSATRKA